MPTLRLLIKGKVQGVFFRAETKRLADRLGIDGWVRNTPEGDVEILASGSQEVLQKLISFCHRGPSGARVSGVSMTPREEIPEPGFRIRK
jgi:acylphosphatase